MFDIASLQLSLQQKPRGDRLVVLPLVKARKGFLIDAEENREKPEKGLVLCIGPGGIGPETGRPFSVEARVGELVSYGRYAGLKFEVEGPFGPVDVYVMRDAEILLAQPPETVNLVMHESDPKKVHEVGLHCEWCPKEDAEAHLERLREIGGIVGPAAGGSPDPEALIAEERARVPSGPALVVEK